MSPQLTGAERDDFLAEPHVAVLAIPRGERPPHTTPVWYHHQPGGNVTFFTGTQGRKSRKADLIEQAGVISLCVQQETFPYKYVTVEGTIVQIDRKADRRAGARHRPPLSPRGAGAGIRRG